MVFIFLVQCNLMVYFRGSRAASTREAARGGGGPSWGRGNTLGSDETESATIPDPNVDDEDVETAVRNIIFWRTGFTIENGPLLLYSDPDSAQLLESIQQGYVYIKWY